MEALSGNSLPFINGGRPIEQVPELPTWLSLAVIVAAIGGSALASVIKMRREQSAGQTLGQ
jgi:tellurite resistance protein TerC